MYLAVAAVLDRLLNGPFLLEVFSELPLESLENVFFLFIINTKSLGRYLIRSNGYGSYKSTTFTHK